MNTAPVNSKQLKTMIEISLDCLNHDFDHKNALHEIQHCSNMLQHVSLYNCLKYAPLVADALVLVANSMVEALSLDEARAFLITQNITDEVQANALWWQASLLLAMIE